MEKRKCIERHLNEGKSQSEIARLLKISRSSVQLIQKKSVRGLGLQDQQKSGRPQVLSKRDKHALIVQSKKNPFLTARQVKISANVLKASISTVKRVLRQNNLMGRVAAPKPLINRQQRQKRLKFCRAHKHWNSQDWKRVIFSDECKIELKSRRRQFVRRPVGSRFNHKYVKGVTKFVQGIMVWGAMRSDGARAIVRCPQTLDSTAYQDVLSEGLPRVYNTRFIFQQDGATCHRSKSTTHYLTQKCIRTLPDFPPQSPDLTIIENIWDLLKRQVECRQPCTLEELWKVIQEEWEKIPASIFERLYESMPNRVAAVLNSNGRSTSY